MSGILKVSLFWQFYGKTVWEGVQGPNEVIYLPNGLLHTVLNLDMMMLVLPLCCFMLIFSWHSFFALRMREVTGSEKDDPGKTETIGLF